jgi:neogenin
MITVCFIHASNVPIIIITAKPEVNQEPKEMSLFVGQTVYFKCMSSQNIFDNKNYRIQWMKNNQQLRIDDTRMLILPSGALEIDELTTQDRGIYQCNVSYENFHRTSSKINLSIKQPSGNPENFAPPSFVVTPSTQTVREKDNVILDCATNGNPKPKITWLRDGVDIDFK